ncbi:MAG TPA: VOC family protein [Polyangiaceae bacterium]|nr:VOC family protein [Polyangiaceae bacterium]
MAKKKKKKVKPIPRGYHSVSASLNVESTMALVEFCKKTFGAKLRSTMPGPDGKIIHAEIEIGDSVIMSSDAVREAARPANLFVYVSNVDKVMAKAEKAGAKVMMPAADMFWGDRFGRVEDPQGNRWAIATHVEDVTPKELKKRMKAMPPPPGE